MVEGFCLFRRHCIIWPKRYAKWNQLCIFVEDRRRLGIVKSGNCVLDLPLLSAFAIFSLKRDCRHLQKTVSENGYHSRRHKNVISATACIPDGIYKFVTFLYKLGYLMPVSNGLPEYLQICEPGFEAPQR